ncbi:MAG: peptidoglycan-binding protein [Streptomyces sp.]|nr:peptidoglycan-binding protein [Streptomyces sp.]
MTRAKTTPDEQPEQAAPDDATDVAEPQTSTAPDDTTALYEPYPGADFFHGGRHSAIFTAMGGRLEQEGCTDSRRLGPDWTNAHRDAFAAWQKKLRPKEAGDVSGIPDETAWDRLHVPRISPLPKDA